MRTSAAIAGLVALLLALPTHAEPVFARLYQQQFGYMPSCNACHKDGGGTPANDYGMAFKDAGMNAAAWSRIAGLDSDGDGIGNEAEARARANPGSARSSPAAPGDWLDIASLIPQEVQAAFPDVRAYLPKDVLLTEADIARAAKLGARLTRDDDNTLYIPLVDRRPVGTALIFPVQVDDRSFFLLMTTDRQLTVQSVSVLNSRQVPEAADLPLYGRFKGVALDALPAASGDGLEAAITRAVKNAGTLVYVRLKGA